LRLNFTVIKCHDIGVYGDDEFNVVRGKYRTAIPNPLLYMAMATKSRENHNLGNFGVKVVYETDELTYVQ